MTGNVYEWCADWFTDSWAAAGHRLDGAPTRDPPGPAAGELKVLRGGSWYDSPMNTRCANRLPAQPVLSAANWGFRPCLRLSNALLARLLADDHWGLEGSEMMGIKE